MGKNSKAIQERADVRRTKEEVAAQADAAAKAENEAKAQAIENKTARLRSLRLARGAEDRRTEPNPPAMKRKRR